MDKAVGPSGQWTHLGPQSASVMEPDHFFFSFMLTDKPLAAWQVPVIWGFIISFSLLICIVCRNIWINLCPRRTLGALLRPCSHLCVSKVSLQNEIYSIWKLWRLLWLRKKKKFKYWHKSENSLWKYVELIDYSCDFPAYIFFLCLLCVNEFVLDESIIIKNISQMMFYIFSMKRIKPTSNNIALITACY